MLLLHIIIAISTVGVSGVTLIKPSSAKLKISYLMTGATFVTGTYLVIVSPAYLVSSCITGLVFLGVVGSILFVANNRLSRIKS